MDALENTWIFVFEPQDNSTFQNRSVSFRCQDDSVSFPPIWNISGKYYYRTHLPRNYIYHARQLTYFDVRKSDDGNTYQCFFHNGTYSSISRIATLQVYKGKQQWGLKE